MTPETSNKINDHRHPKRGALHCEAEMRDFVADNLDLVEPGLVQ